jgi:lysophospholipid acyltransferase (LPLAT)-like uncharacterized protein
MSEKRTHPRKVRFLAFLGWLIVSLWCATLRVRVRLPQQTNGLPMDLTEQSFVMALWHDSLLTPMWLLPRMKLRPAVMISKSGDGELVAQVGGRFGWRVVRGSSSRGGSEALEEAANLYEPKKPFQFLFTVDGPRGPRRECKFGVVALAARLGLPVLPVTVRFENAWYAKSWDRMAIPKPFSKVEVLMDRFVSIPSPASRDDLEQSRRQVEETMHSVEVGSSNSITTEHTSRAA